MIQMRPSIRSVSQFAFATVIQKTRRIPRYAAVQVPLVAEREDEFVARLTPQQRFVLGDSFTGVFNHPGAGDNVRFRKAAGAVNGRFAKANQRRFRRRQMASIMSELFGRLCIDAVILRLHCREQVKTIFLQKIPPSARGSPRAFS